MKLKVKLFENYKELGDDIPLPQFETAGAAGIDLRACVKTVHTLLPGHKQTIGTGIGLELPRGYEGQVRPRSGLASKQGITVINSPGTVDSDYRGEIKVTIVNHGRESYMVEPGMRIAQLVIAKHETPELDFVEELSNTERGDKGHGSTGTE